MLFCAQEIIRRAISRGVPTDHHLVARLVDAIDRLGLHTDARELGISADVLAEVRMAATAVAKLILT